MKKFQRQIQGGRCWYPKSFNPSISWNTWLNFLEKDPQFILFKITAQFFQTVTMFSISIALSTGHQSTPVNESLLHVPGTLEATSERVKIIIDFAQKKHKGMYVLDADCILFKQLIYSLRISMNLSVHVCIWYELHLCQTTDICILRICIKPRTMSCWKPTAFFISFDKWSSRISIKPLVLSNWYDRGALVKLETCMKTLQ